MHVEVPKSHSFRQFAGEYIMIVVSILTALALENAVHRYHQSHKAHEAARNLDAEIAVNIAEVRSAIKSNDAELKRIGKLGEALLADIKAGLGDKEAIRHAMKETGSTFGFNITIPSLQREAWDVAVANQALSYMPQDQLQRYAKQYANMRDAQAMLNVTGNSFVDLPSLADTMSDMKTGDITSRALYRTISQLVFVYEQNGANMRSLEKMLVEEQRNAAGH
jgi:hypothetical protein